MTAIHPRLANPETGWGTEPVIGRRARVDAIVRVLAAASLWLSLLLVSYWWMVDSRVGAGGGWATGLMSVGRLTGLVASVLLLAQVVLMARIPVLEHAYGQDRLARLHRLVGFTSFTLMLVHIVTITWGYSAGELARTPVELWTLAVDYPGMLLAVAGTACLLMVVITSVKAARQRLRYESWHLLHLYAYLGVGLALPHQLWAGQEFSGSTVRALFWWTVWAAAGASVLVWRVGQPVRLNLRHRIRVAAVVDEGEGIWSVYLTGTRLQELPVEPGQFFSWRFMTGPGWTRSHPYSLSAAPGSHGLRITVQGVGDGSVATRELQPGTRAIIEGPYGRLSARTRTRPKIALIGAGVGTTPLRALAEGLPYAPGEAVWIERFATHPLFATEIDRLARDRGLDVLRLPGHRRAHGSWLGHGVGRADDLTALLFWVPDIAERDVYVCGPKPWTDVVGQVLTAAGVRRDHLHSETFSW